MSDSDEFPLDEEYISPPALTDSSSGSMSDEGETLDDASADATPVVLSELVSREADGFADLLSRAWEGEECMDEDARKARLDSRTGSMLQRVFQLLSLVADKRAFVFVDRSTRHHLLPHLYHTVTIDLSSYPYVLPAVTALFDKKNPGLVHIKRIVFDGSNIVDKTRPPVGFTCLASMAIEKLPLYQLEYFDWPADLALAPMFSLRLMDRQDELRNLQLYENTLNVRGHERKDTIEALDQLVALRISPESTDSLRHTYHILKNRPLEELHLDLRNYVPKQIAFDYNDPVAKQLDVVQILFQHAKPLHACPARFQLPLKRLVLWNVNLARSAQTWHKAMKENVLREVEISHCAWPGKFFDGLALVQSSLIKVKVHHDDALDDPTKLPAMKQKRASFVHDLQSFLKAKAMNASDDGPAKVQHRLQYLEVHLTRHEDEYDPVLFNHIGLHVSAMQVLCMDMFIDEGKLGRNHITNGPDSHPAYWDADLALGACASSQIRQLCYPNFLFTDSGTNLNVINPVTLMLLEYSDTSSVAQSAANSVLHRLRRVHKNNTRLRVLAIKSGHETPITEHFVRREVVIMGRKAEIMAPVSYMELKKHEKEIDILEPPPVALGKHGRV